MSLEEKSHQASLMAGGVVVLCAGVGAGSGRGFMRRYFFCVQKIGVWLR
jgi:hypothetical protein